MKLARERYRPINIFVNFRISNKFVNVPGFSPSKIVENKILVEYCFGECIFSEGYFTISAMSISKFYNQQTHSITRDTCTEYDGKHWDCIDALCNYATRTGTCTSPTIGMINSNYILNIMHAFTWS